MHSPDKGFHESEILHPLFLYTAGDIHSIGRQLLDHPAHILAVQPAGNDDSSRKGPDPGGKFMEFSAAGAGIVNEIAVVDLLRRLLFRSQRQIGHPNPFVHLHLVEGGSGRRHVVPGHAHHKAQDPVAGIGRQPNRCFRRAEALAFWIGDHTDGVVSQIYRLVDLRFGFEAAHFDEHFLLPGTEADIFRHTRYRSRCKCQKIETRGNHG